MSKLLVIVGIAIVSTIGFATDVGAKVASYWKRTGSTYSCQGTGTLTLCHSRLAGQYKVLVNGRGIYVYTGGATPVFVCHPGGDMYSDCEDLRP